RLLWYVPSYTHDPRASPLRRILGRGEEKRPDAATPDMRGDGDRIEPGQLRARRVGDERIAGERASLLGDEEGGVGGEKKAAEAAARQVIDSERGLLHGEERSEIAEPVTT